MITRVRPAGVLVGYAVVAADGPVGAIDRDTYDSGRLVVDGGDGQLIRLPVDSVQRIDHRARTVHLGMTREAVARELRRGAAGAR